MQVASFQTLFARSQRPCADLVVVDEAHHANAGTYSEVLSWYPDAQIVGLSATPQRLDGRPLGDMFDAMVSTVGYERLIADGNLVDCHVFGSPQNLKAGAVATDPVAAYQQHTPGGSSFLFAPTVELSKEHARAFNAAGIPAEHVDGATPADERAASIRRFSEGVTRVLCNVNVFTEGTDIPRADTVILARGCTSVGLYLQMVGRALRPFAGKSHATLLDLTGASLAHGLPTAERTWTLEGSGNGAAKDPLFMCMSCGACYEKAGACPCCGYVRPKPVNSMGVEVDIRNLELLAVYAGSDTRKVHKNNEARRLYSFAKEQGLGPTYVRTEYDKLFSEPVDLNKIVPKEDKAAYYEKLKSASERIRGNRKGWIAHRYRDVFGVWPRPGTM